MSSNNDYYFHFVTDLRRIVFCLENQDLQGVKIFRHHANKIYLEHLKKLMDREQIEVRFDELWLELFDYSIPNSPIEQKKYSERVLALSTLIFLRSSQVKTVRKHQTASRF